MDDWAREVTDLVSYVDIRASFVSRVSTRDESLPLPLNPWSLADALAKTRAQVLAEIVPDVENALRELRPLEKTYQHEGTPLVTTVELVDVKEGGRRNGTIGYPGISGYSPAGVFRTVVERALRKARRRQTKGIAASGRALVVYLMESKIAEDLVVPAHNREAEEVVKEIEPRDHGLDAIAFVVRALPEGLAAIFTVYDDSTLTLAQVEAMFSQPTR